MPLSFPSTPSLNDTYTSGSVTWRWNGYAWDVEPNEDPTFDDVYATTFHGVLNGNANTASTLFTARQINGVSFNGSQNISLDSLIKDNHTVTLDSSGNLLLTASTQITNVSAGAVRLRSTANNGSAEIMLNNDSVLNTVGVYESNIQITALNETSPNVYTGTGITVNATTGINVTGVTTFGSTVTATGNITANANVNIPAQPTQPQHATNKSYVDTRAVAFSIGLS